MTKGRVKVAEREIHIVTLLCLADPCLTPELAHNSRLGGRAGFVWYKFMAFDRNGCLEKDWASGAMFRQHALRVLSFQEASCIAMMRHE